MNSTLLTRRRLLAMAGAATAGALVSRVGFADATADTHHDAAAAGSGLDLNSERWNLPAPRRIKLATNLNAVCLAPVAVADSQGIFERHNLDVEFVNFGHSTEVLLESMATGKADAATGMALRWLKALEQGFDVKLTAGTHGGCLRLVTRDGGPTDLASLRGQSIGVTDMAAPDKNFFSLQLKKHGVDPVRDVTWRVYPVDLLGTALEKGEIQAASGSDPIMYRLKEQSGFTELASNLSGVYANMSCCVVGASGNLVREQRPVAAAVTHAILQAHAWAARHPDAVAEAFLEHAVNTSQQEVRNILTEQTQGHYSVGGDFVKELAVYAEDLKRVEVLRAGTDPTTFAESIHADVFA